MVALNDFSEMLRAADWLMIGYYAFISLVLLWSVFTAILVFQRRISWGQARRMGIPWVMFIWIQAVFYLALAEGAYSIASFLLKIPLWVDLVFLGGMFALILFIAFRLRQRPTFKPHLFIPLVLVPLGIPGTHFIGTLAREGAIEVVPVAGVAVLKYGNEAKEFVAKNADSWLDSVPLVRQFRWAVDTVAGPVRFVSSHAMGRLGDRITALRLGGLGYTKLISKYDPIHGIDGIYVKKGANGILLEVLLVENKVGNGRLAGSQMDDAWVLNRLQRLLDSSSEKSRTTARLVLDALENNPSIVKKQLWHHDLKSGVTVASELDGRGAIIRKLVEYRDKLIENELTRRCANQLPVCYIS